MATLRCFSPNAIIIPRKISSKTVIKACMDDLADLESKKAPNSVSFSSKVYKVYEDKNVGVLCYNDENGELVCEGLDEGPRMTRQDMEKLSRERKLRTKEDRKQRPLPIAAGIDWSFLQAAVSQGKN